MIAAIFISIPLAVIFTVAALGIAVEYLDWLDNQ